MNITYEEVEEYLNEVRQCILDNRYQISARDKNKELYIDYIFSEELCRQILLELEVRDFADAVQNEHPSHPEEILYVFGREVSLVSKQSGENEDVSLYIKINKLADVYVIVVSLHKQQYPIKYKFR